MLKRIREPVNALTHLGAAVAAVAGVVALLVVGRDSWAKQLSLLVYGARLIFMLTASGIYHLIRTSPRRQQILRKLDHSAIFVLIAGTYTPICFNLFDGFWNWGMLALIWFLALVGTISKVFIIETPRWFTTAVYLVMGWLALIALPEIVAVLPPGALFWLLLGGVVFTLGAVVYATQTLDFFPHVFGFHEVWHLFVIGGCLCHFIAILAYVAPAAPLA